MSATGKGPPPMWRSVAERDATDDARLQMLDEFPGLGARMDAGLDRRTALKFMGAALALGGLSACSAPADEILPYVDQPEGLIPGIPQFYATTLLAEGFGIGALVESHEGRPTKVEGNPDHPASRGATDAVMQAACLDLFDPERSRVPLRRGEPASLASVDLMLSDLHRQLKATGGKRAAILTGGSTSPTLNALLGDLGRAFPGIAPLPPPAAGRRRASIFAASAPCCGRDWTGRR